MNKFILFLFFILVVSCSSKSSDRYREGNNAGQKSALTVDEEKQLTKDALSDMKKEYPPVNHPALHNHAYYCHGRI